MRIIHYENHGNDLRLVKVIYQLKKLTKLLSVVIVTKECKHVILEKHFHMEH